MAAIVDLAKYVFRVIGLLIAVVMSATVCVMSFFSKDGTILFSAASAWVAVAACMSFPRLPNSWRGDPPTERQIQYAESLGIRVPDGATKGRVSDMIEAVKSSRSL